MNKLICPYCHKEREDSNYFQKGSGEAPCLHCGKRFLYEIKECIVRTCFTRGKNE